MRFLCCTGELRIMCLLGAGVLACVRNSLQAVFVHCLGSWGLVALGGQSNALFCGVFLCGSKFHSCSRLHLPFSRISKPGLGFLSQFSPAQATSWQPGTQEGFPRRAGGAKTLSMTTPCSAFWLCLECGLSLLTQSAEEPQARLTEHAK